MNKFVTVGAYANGKHLHISSEKASLELFDEVMKIVCQTATYTFFEGELKCVYDYTPEPLLKRVNQSLEYLTDNCIQDKQTLNSISKLEEYIKAVEV
jgi:hypothetical protein